MRMILTVEGPLIRNVVDQEDTHRAAVIGRRDGAESLLAGGVPNLQLHALAV